MFRSLPPIVLSGLCLVWSPARADEGLAVEFVTVRDAQVTYDVVVSGTLEARDSVDLGFRQGGRVTKVLVEEGDRVQAGQELARTDSVQQNQALSVAEASLSAAQATDNQARQALQRQQALLERGVGTRAARDRAQQARSQADGALRRALAQVDQARRAVEDTVLRAPDAAVVTARSADPGQIVGAAQTVVSLAKLGGFEAVFQPPNTSALDQAMGAEVKLEMIDISAPDMVGHVTEIAPLVDPLTGSVTTRVLVDDQITDTRLLGAAVRGTVHLPAGASNAVPWTALTRDGADPAVWLVGEDGRVSLTPVVIERFVDGEVLLTSGVSQGQTVVGAGSQMLYPGRAVTDAAEGEE